MAQAKRICYFSAFALLCKMFLAKKKFGEGRTVSLVLLFVFAKQTLPCKHKCVVAVLRGKPGFTCRRANDFYQHALQGKNAQFVLPKKHIIYAQKYIICAEKRTICSEKCGYLRGKSWHFGTNPVFWPCRGSLVSYKTKGNKKLVPLFVTLKIWRRN